MSDVTSEGGLVTRLGRRGFLAGLAGAAAGFAGLGAAGSASAAVWLACPGRDLVPGDVVRVPWPSCLDFRRITVAHTRNGQTMSRWPCPVPMGDLVPVVEITARPPRGHLGPGRHDFFLEADGRRFWMGGFDLKTYEFGF